MNEIAKFARRIDAPAVVAGAAFTASAGHIVHVVNETNPIVFALAYPIGIDGLLYVGIKAMKERRFVTGTIALLIGAFYSLAFNSHAEGAFVMPKILIASSMPVCLLAAFVIEHFGKKAEVIEEITETAVEPVRNETEWDRMNERVETRLRAEHALAMETMKSDFEKKFAALYAERETVKIPAATVERPAAAPVEAPKAKAITDGRTGSGRVASWDVEKAVALIVDGRTNEEVASTVGTNAKAIQRTRRVMKTDGTDAEVATLAGVSAAHVARVRAAMITKENA